MDINTCNTITKQHNPWLQVLEFFFKYSKPMPLAATQVDLDQLSLRPEKIILFSRSGIIGKNYYLLVKVSTLAMRLLYSHKSSCRETWAE